RFAGIDSVLDLGSGPLTFPIALWLSFPELRIKPLRVVVQDKSGQPLEFGQRLLEARCRQQKQPLVWEIKRLVGNMSIVHSQLMRQKFSLIYAVNVFNEFCVQKKNVRQQERENWGGMGEVLEQIQLLLSDQGYFLSIEPGTRWGGKIMMQLRAMALSMGLHIELPCTHEQKCPLMHRSWCHTTFEANGAPSWLRALSAAAGLEKETLSLACLLVRRGQKKQSKKCFVLSEPFSVPNLSGMARYACSGKGLLLLEDAASLAQGTRFVVEVPGHASIDKKSSALIVKRR
ncbi:MAG: hypothetical protein IK079_03695, partial [Desulfovibrio sp.]|nr:hypothetical protein [Desulfovibrio sp.]